METPAEPTSVWPLAESRRVGRAGRDRNRGRGRGRGRSRRGWSSLASHPLGRLAEGVVEVELGGVVLVDGGGILLVGGIESLNRLHNFLGANDQAKQLSGGPRRLAQADEVLVGRFDRLAHTFFRLHDANSCRLQPG